MERAGAWVVWGGAGGRRDGWGGDGDREDWAVQGRVRQCGKERPFGWWHRNRNGHRDTGKEGNLLFVNPTPSERVELTKYFLQSLM